MRKVNYHLTDRQIAALREAADESGLSVAELIRRAIDAYMGGLPSSAVTTFRPRTEES
jgi:hypothetical protein